MRNPILDLPVTAVMRSEIAMPLQQILRIYTVGCFLRAWRNPNNHRTIEGMFDTPQQARHAAATCAGWLGVRTMATPNPVPQWWRSDEGAGVGARSV